MNPYHLEIWILIACDRKESHEWTGSIADLANRIREMGGVEPPEYTHIVEAITELCRSGELLVRKWRDNEGFESFDSAKGADGAYTSDFFFTRDFRMKLTHSGRRRLVELPMPELPRERIGF